MFTIEEISDMLDELADEIPAPLFSELNGGVNLLPDTKHHPVDGLFIMGEYCHNQLGRYINIYYGSICRVYPNTTKSAMRKQLKRILTHELTHHVEALAGERGLEIKDELELDRYRNS